ncbi:class II glutamine amidotransferase [Enhygromyxa salina]|nr:class II glutamine amidotransferase [Enhygromyxa salina]
MCRFAMYLGPPIKLSALVTEPSNSIIHQSYDAQEREEPLNGDGFGVAWYVPELRDEPAVFKSISPAWNNANLLNLAPVTRSHCLLAHVRAASPGLAVAQVNCHPFVRERFAFMHNGSVGGFARLRRRLRERLSDLAYDAIAGSTDSEHVLALLSDRWLEALEPDPLERAALALRETIELLEHLRAELDIEEPSYLNLAITDGAAAMVCRYVSPGPDPAHSLYYARGALVVEDGKSRIDAPKSDGPAVVVASEPLGDRSRWEAVPRNHLVLIDDQRRVNLREI